MPTDDDLVTNVDASSSGIATARAFVDAFNAQDHEALADTLNYPHVRLANDRFTTIESRDDFITRSRKGKEYLEAEGWHHTMIGSIEVIHGSHDKGTHGARHRPLSGGRRCIQSLRHVVDSHVAEQTLGNPISL